MNMTCNLPIIINENYTIVNYNLDFKHFKKHFDNIKTCRKELF